MQKTIAVSLLALSWFCWSGITQADDVGDSPICMKPDRPDFQLQSEYADFRQAVRSYERCIKEYIDGQEQAAQQHLDAAKKARDEWDRFVSSVLR